MSGLIALRHIRTPRWGSSSDSRTVLPRQTHNSESRTKRTSHIQHSLRCSEPNWRTWSLARSRRPAVCRWTLSGSLPPKSCFVCWTWHTADRTPLYSSCFLVCSWTAFYDSARTSNCTKGYYSSRSGSKGLMRRDETGRIIVGDSELLANSAYFLWKAQSSCARTRISKKRSLGRRWGYCEAHRRTACANGQAPRFWKYPHFLLLRESNYFNYYCRPLKQHARSSNCPWCTITAHCRW